MGKLLTFRIKSRIEDIYPVEQDILNEAIELGYDEDTRYCLRLALDEALINAIMHGNQSLEHKTVFIDAACDRDQISVSIRDEGRGFDRTQLPDPTKPPFLTETCGRGVFLIKQFTHEVRFNDIGNEITFVLNRNRPVNVMQST